jgi:heavy metal efflux system protein
MKRNFLGILIEWSLANKFWVIFVSIIFLILTLSKIDQLSVDAVPDITNIQVVINTKTKGLDPEKVELTVTHPIEQEMMGIPGLIDMRSISKLGLSQITLIFNDGVDIYWARQQVSEKLQIAIGSLPQGISPELAPISTGLGEVFMYALSLKENSALLKLSHKEQMLYLREIQDFQIRPVLRKVTGVADIDSNGGMKKELHVNLRPEDLNKYGLTIDKVERALNGIGESFGGGSIVVNNESLVIRSSVRIDKLQDLESLALTIKWNGRPVLLKDVATISLDAAPRLGSATYNAKETVLGTVLMRSGGNGRQVSADVDRELDQIILPPDVELTKLYSRAFLVNTTLQTVTKNLAEGAILVILVLLVVLGHWRAALLVSLVIPLSMLGTTLGMQSFHISGNLMSLGAIDFGLVVDGAVVLVETIVSAFYCLSSEERATLKKDQIVSLKAQEVMRPIVFGLFMIMLVYLPILLLEGVEGKMFRPMALTVLMTLGWSLIFTIFLIPVLVSLFIKIPPPSESEHETWLFRFVKKFYTPILERSLRHPLRLMLGGVLILGLSGVVFLRLGSDFIPQLDEGDLVINITRNARISLEEALKEQVEVEKIWREFPEVELVFSRLGTPESATDPMGVHLTDTFLILKKDRQLWRFKSKEELFQELKSAAEKLKFEADFSSTQPIEMRFNEMLEGSRADVSLRIMGVDLSYLVDVIDSFAQKVQNIPGLEGAEMDPLTALRKSRVVDITPRFSELSSIGVELETFNQNIQAFMQGVRIGNWTQGEKKIPILMHLSEEKRDNLEEIKKLPIVLPDGGAVPLEQLAQIELKEQVTTIARSWGRRYAALSLNIVDRDTLSFVNDVREVVKKNPPREGHKIILGGQFNNLERAKKRLLIIIPLTLLIIIFILWREFQSILDALIIFLCIPFAASGGLFALYLRDIHLSLSAAVGFIALIGIALLNGIVLFTIYNQLKSAGLNTSELVIKGTLSRLRPVIMTAMVASIGFIPMAINTGLGSEVQRPLATVVIGGIIFSTVLTLVIIPSIYLYFHQLKERSQKIV